MNSNINIEALDRVATVSNQIRHWFMNFNHPERYSDVNDLCRVVNFVHQIDLLETVLMRFEVQAHMAKLALQELSSPEVDGSLAYEFWRIDVEETFASSTLELGYQIKNGWKALSYHAKHHDAFDIFRMGYKEPSDTFLARHKATHFQPDQFLEHNTAKEYSILRRPYHVDNGEIKKELAKATLPKVAKLIRSSFTASDEYLHTFWAATVGENN
ncbi:hypothetical protein [Agarivorans sp. 1_MG-2023]|uniref:hypothetical protein n=1 Tax=Agarivorans sp. 1_MG-2023 TaxID=3062634 RepID=UPI0026E321AC|nr:hypothetical protein [Agarivorans sp. 1_MG-2023]MDO6762874.1 hypothetical protein [Agarivorans sp. 1_MG-2023]